MLLLLSLMLLLLLVVVVVAVVVCNSTWVDEIAWRRVCREEARRDSPHDTRHRR